MQESIRDTTPRSRIEGVRTVFSGIQPSGDVQLGNYIGAIKGWVDRQEEKENYFCIVDLHALTVPQEPDELRHQTRSLAAMLFAAGLDPEKCTIFVQSPRDGARRGVLAAQLRHAHRLAGAHDAVQGEGGEPGERVDGAAGLPRAHGGRHPALRRP